MTQSRHESFHVNLPVLRKIVFVPGSWYFVSKRKLTSPTFGFQSLRNPVSARAFWRTSSSV